MADTPVNSALFSPNSGAPYTEEPSVPAYDGLQFKILVELQVISTLLALIAGVDDLGQYRDDAVISIT